jgi:hypothetical protein
MRTARYCLPIVGGWLSAFAALQVGAPYGWFLLILSFGLIIEGATAMWERAGGTGNLTTHRQ